MQIPFRLAFIVLAVASTTVGCSYINTAPTPANTISMAEIRGINSDVPRQKHAASIHIVDFEDSRMMSHPRKIGTGAMLVFGLTGKDILLDQDVALIVTSTMKQGLDKAGFTVIEDQSQGARFELSGVVKELTYNVAARDQVSIILEITLRDLSTDNTVWSGIVAEKNERFAGVSGNNKMDVAKFLREELDIVTSKTTGAINTRLNSSHPELFHLNQAPQTIPGVTELVTPTLTVPATEVAPTVAKLLANPTNGQLQISTHPPRAGIYLDNVYYGLSPLQLELAPGVYTVNVRLKGYKVMADKVSVRTGDKTEIEIELNLEQ